MTLWQMDLLSLEHSVAEVIKSADAPASHPTETVPKEEQGRFALL